MTEDQASEKWCPFSRIALDYTDEASSNTVAVNRMDGDIPSGSLCIGSECMAWRQWGGVYIEGKWVDPGGYCGLAGKP